MSSQRAADLKTALPFLVVAMAVWAGSSWFRNGGPPPVTRPAWQEVTTERSEADQRTYAALRRGLLDAEQRRVADGRWPEPSALKAPFDDARWSWELRTHGIYATYVGVPKVDGDGRWLVLFIEPDPRAAKEKPPPDDDEHHLVGDLALHVTVWTQPNVGALPPGAVAFPATDGWTQLVAP